VLLSPELEEQLAAAVRVSARGSQFALHPGARQGLLARIEQLLRARQLPGLVSVLPVHMAEIRPALRALLRDSGHANQPVLSVEELRPNLHVRVLGDVEPQVLKQA